MTKYIPPPPKLADLDPTNWEHQELAKALKVARCGSLCPSGHPWLRYGVLRSDGRVRCKQCELQVGRNWRRKRRTIAKIGQGES